MEACVKVVDELGIEQEVRICSAHRNPRGVMEWAVSARERGIRVVIAAAGGAAHLPGVVAAWTDLPVIGVPVPTQHLGGVDSLYSIVQMPAGIPVATVAIGEAGAKNAAWLAAGIIGISDGAGAQRHPEKRAALATWPRRRRPAYACSTRRFATPSRRCWGVTCAGPRSFLSPARWMPSGLPRWRRSAAPPSRRRCVGAKIRGLISAS